MLMVRYILELLNAMLVAIFTCTILNGCEASWLFFYCCAVKSALVMCVVVIFTLAACI